MKAFRDTANTTSSLDVIAVGLIACDWANSECTAVRDCYLGETKETGWLILAKQIEERRSHNNAYDAILIDKAWQSFSNNSSPTIGTNTWRSVARGLLQQPVWIPLGIALS
jgi:hypothetical protein